MIDTDFVPTCLHCTGDYDVRERNEEIVRLRARVAELEAVLCDQLISGYGVWEDGSITNVIACDCGAKVRSKGDAKMTDLKHNAHCQLAGAV